MPYTKSHAVHLRIRRRILQSAAENVAFMHVQYEWPRAEDLEQPQQAPRAKLVCPRISYTDWQKNKQNQCKSILHIEWRCACNRRFVLGVPKHRRREEKEAVQQWSAVQFSCSASSCYSKRCASNCPGWHHDRPATDQEAPQYRKHPQAG